MNNSQPCVKKQEPTKNESKIQPNCDKDKKIVPGVKKETIPTNKN
jgi:hypothetical protein